MTRVGCGSWWEGSGVWIVTLDDVLCADVNRYGGVRSSDGDRHAVRRRVYRWGIRREGTIFIVGAEESGLICRDSKGRNLILVEGSWKESSWSVLEITHVHLNDVNIGRILCQGKSLSVSENLCNHNFDFRGIDEGNNADDEEGVYRTSSILVVVLDLSRYWIVEHDDFSIGAGASESLDLLDSVYMMTHDDILHRMDSAENFSFVATTRWTLSTTCAGRILLCLFRRVDTYSKSYWWGYFESDIATISAIFDTLSIMIVAIHRSSQMEDKKVRGLNWVIALFFIKIARCDSDDDNEGMVISIIL
ncbi:hypothetical protein Tco_0774620 [Tanacetum coccineum]|uniref:Uncharacterized protein n=1 Tax=Tanacetum coccineum TaxID=301880 RepID=A0ABQ4ZP01_9ASTR